MLQPKDIDGLSGYKNKPIYMLSTRDPLQTSGHIQTESGGDGKRYSMQMEIKRKLE